MRAEARRWFRQAEADLEAAKHSLASGDYEWSCFQAQQSAEKLCKALLYDRGRTTYLTHSVKELWEAVRQFEPACPDLREAATALDQIYLSTRYPNGLAGEQAPADYYGQEDAQRCVQWAELIWTALRPYLKP